MVGTFPNEAAIIQLVGAIPAHMHDEWQSGGRRYLSEGIHGPTHTNQR
jgi:hypothetical protein